MFWFSVSPETLGDHPLDMCLVYLDLVLTKHKRCQTHGCIPCTALEAVRDGDSVQKMLSDADFLTQKNNPVAEKLFL